MAVTTFKNFDGYKNFDWDLLKSFYFIAKSGSFLEASRLLGVIQPTFTRQMQALEEQLGFPLLIRHASKGVTLTRKGEELLGFMESTMMPWIRGYTTDLDAITNELKKKRRLKLTATHAVIAHRLSNYCWDYTLLNPGLTFDLIADDNDTDIVLNDADIAIQTLDPNRKSGRKVSGVQVDYLYSLTKKLYASPDYIKTYGEPQSVEELENHRMIAFPHSEASVNNRIINWILTLGMPEGELHNPVCTSNSIESMVSAAEKGIGIIGSYEEFDIIKNSSLKNILPEVKDKPSKAYFIYHNHLKKDKVIMDFKDYLMEKLNPLNL